MKHFYQNLKGFASYPEQGELLKALLPLLPKDNIVIAEIGVYRGKGTAMWNVDLINAGINYEYFAIDNFLGLGEGETHDKDYYQIVKENLNTIINNIHLIKNNSEEESKNYPDNYFDIVYLDADHDERSVKNDILHWLPKVKKGGVICGDDYVDIWPGVKIAVDSFFKEVNFIGKQQWWKQV